MISCGVNNVNTFGGKTEAQELATNLFKDEFNTCIDKYFEEIDDDFKSY